MIEVDGMENSDVTLGMTSPEASFAELIGIGPSAVSIHRSSINCKVTCQSLHLLEVPTSTEAMHIIDRTAGSFISTNVHCHTSCTFF
jgi:hypothetical protein